MWNLKCTGNNRARRRTNLLALGGYALLAGMWLPLFVLYLVRTVRGCSVRTAILSGVFLALSGLECWHFLTFAGLLGGLYVGYSLLFERGRWRWRTVALLALIAPNETRIKSRSSRRANSDR